jgi:hypothetical protein
VTHPLMMKRACESAASGRVGRSVDDVRLPGPTRVENRRQSYTGYSSASTPEGPTGVPSPTSRLTDLRLLRNHAMWRSCGARLRVFAVVHEFFTVISMFDLIDRRIKILHIAHWY